MIRSTDGETGAVLTSTSDLLVRGTAVFKGATTIETVATVQARSTTNPELNSDSTTYEYYNVNAANRRYDFHGIRTETSSPFAITVTVSNDPPRFEIYDLDAGQSYMQTYSVTTESSAIPFPIPATSISSTTTYVGREQVSVPAGTFEACKFTDTDGTSNTTRWMAVGSGIFLKSISDGDVNELVSYSINGVPVTGN
ncbi:hypothetical protein JN531_001815 [Flagellatimonas centrodinii]|uniref:hypothetical protein n=1 Tax=Flagellatimonas centrodinii TaxID=2806210 RepID=UPI001FEDF4D6|nr:hypothetical protein [Flagellatimonas centrodinii]ULQ47032.1 hypothetical protein JN531_001815 [Flagellatimonas centrodinii]